MGLTLDVSSQRIFFLTELFLFSQGTLFYAPNDQSVDDRSPFDIWNSCWVSLILLLTLSGSHPIQND